MLGSSCEWVSESEWFAFNVWQPWNSWLYTHNKSTIRWMKQKHTLLAGKRFNTIQYWIHNFFRAWIDSQYTFWLKVGNRFCVRFSIKMLCCCCKVLWRLVALLFYLLCHQYIMRCQDQFHRYLNECDWIHTGIHFSLRITYTQTHALLSRVPWTWPIINGFEKKTFRIRKDCVLENLCGRYRYIVYISFFAPMSKAINVSIIHLKQDTHVYINFWKRKTIFLALMEKK